jgi:hypothetical protein
MLYYYKIEHCPFSELHSQTEVTLFPFSRQLVCAFVLTFYVIVSVVEVRCGTLRVINW